MIFRASCCKMADKDVTKTHVYGFYMKKRTFNRLTLKGMTLLLIVWILGAAACAAPASLPVKEEPIIPDKDAYSVFIYLCGSDLETKHGAATKNIQELLDADVGDDVNIVLQTGGTKKWRSFGISSTSIQRYEIEEGALQLLESLPNDSMGKASTLADFLCYGIENYPAEKYAAILWDHGGGSISGIAFDEQYRYDALSLGELQEAFEKTTKTTKTKFELIGLDACLMATLEAAQMLAPFGSYMVASQEISPTTGWNYTAIGESLSQRTGGKELGETICDSYYEKCYKLGKEQTVTLSVIDLNKVDLLTESFDSLSKKMEYHQEDLSYIAQCVENSPCYGGATKQEGHSNLFDLGCFADNMEATGVLTALEETVIYQRTGEQRAQATGLSVYYPQTFDSNELKQYLQICPDSKYAEFLKDAYSNIPQGIVEFLDAGSAADNDGMFVRLSLNSIKYVSTVEFELDKTDDKGHTIKFGIDNNLYDDWEAGLFTSDFNGYWIALDGEFLQSHPVDETENSLMFSAPILLNGEPTNLRFAYVFDQQIKDVYGTLDGHYEMLGTWSGLDKDTGMSKADLAPINVGDEITIMREGLSGELEQGSTLNYQSNSAIHDRPLEEGNYLYRFIITDIFGDTHASNTAIFAVKQADQGNPMVKLVQIDGYTDIY